MGVSIDAAPASGPADRLGFRPAQIVIEFGYDDDVDEQFRESIEDLTGETIEDEDYDGVIDAVLLWWRDGDGDLVDALVDSTATLEEGGFLVLLTPGVGRSDRLPVHVVTEACTTSGLNESGAQPVGPEWVGQRLVGRR